MASFPTRSLLLLCALLWGLPSPSSSLVLHERRGLPDGWTALEYADKAEIVTFHVCLPQRNLDMLEKLVLAGSMPSSPSYGQHLSIQDIKSLVSPYPHVTEAVLSWISSYTSSFLDLGDTVRVTASVGTVNHMFNVKMQHFSHENGAIITRVFGAVHIPHTVSDYVEMVSGLIEFPRPRRSHFLLEANATDPGVIVPEILQHIYNVPSAFPVHPNSSLCVVEFLGDSSYNETDLKQFAQMMGIPAFTPAHVVGPFDGSLPDAESTLDIQYGGAIALNTSLWFWTSKGWMYDFASDLFNAAEAPLVVSMSWGWPEPWQCQDGVGNCSVSQWTSAEYVSRVNTEFMKISARGITLVAASGDQGAPGDENPGCGSTPDNSPLSNLFPASSPWVTAVGATMLKASTTPIKYQLPPLCKDINCATNGTEIVCTIPESLITTGGGFSTFVEQPSWQSDQVSAYFSSGVPMPPTPDFNGSNRAYPDVSALGHNYIIQWGGSPVQVDGTSCSSPVFAAIIALLNSHRMNAGKGPLGFANPMLYDAAASDATIYHDMVTGNNKCTESCCSKFGFDAAKGWDPVTGLGTPDFSGLLGYVDKLQ